MTEGYRLVMASDVSDRNGLGLELYDPSGHLVAEIFRDDDDGSRTFRMLEQVDLPTDVVRWFLERAQDTL
jgi:hypothetical protein